MNYAQKELRTAILAHDKARADFSIARKALTKGRRRPVGKGLARKLLAPLAEALALAEADEIYWCAEVALIAEKARKGNVQSLPYDAHEAAKESGRASFQNFLRKGR